MTTHSNRECCEKCRGRFTGTCANFNCPCHKDTMSMEEKYLWCDGGRECRCICHQTDYALPKDMLDTLSPSLPEWSEGFDERFGGGDESGDYPSSAIKSFIKEVETQAEKRGREEQRQFQESEIAKSANEGLIYMARQEGIKTGLERAIKALPKKETAHIDDFAYIRGFNVCISLVKDSLNKLLTNHE